MALDHIIIELEEKEEGIFMALNIVTRKVAALFSYLEKFLFSFVRICFIRYNPNILTFIKSGDNDVSIMLSQRF
jgi:hypothetical protein